MSNPKYGTLELLPPYKPLIGTIRRSDAIQLLSELQDWVHSQWPGVSGVSARSQHLATPSRERCCEWAYRQVVRRRWGWRHPKYRPRNQRTKFMTVVPENDRDYRVLEHWPSGTIDVGVLSVDQTNVLVPQLHWLKLPWQLTAHTTTPGLAQAELEAGLRDWYQHGRSTVTDGSLRAVVLCFLQDVGWLKYQSKGVFEITSAQAAEALLGLSARLRCHWMAQIRFSTAPKPETAAQACSEFQQRYTTLLNTYRHKFIQLDGTVSNDALQQNIAAMYRCLLEQQQILATAQHDLRQLLDTCQQLQTVVQERRHQAAYAQVF